MLTYDLSDRGKIPLYDYLYRCIKNDILSKKLKADEKLPSKRQLAMHLKISVITVENAYAQLAVEGYIYSAEKRGYFVRKLDDVNYAPPKTVSVSPPEKKEEYILDLSSSRIDEKNFPFSIWSKLMRQSLSEKDTNLLKSVPRNGIYELRRSICDYLYRFLGMEINENRIVIGAGTEYLYTLLVQLFGDGNTFSVENPGYKKVSNIFTACGAKWVYTDLDENGISIKNLKNSSANIVHTSPTHHYPTGITMPVSRRRELLNWAYEKEGRYIIEDDYDSEFRFSGRPLPKLCSMDSGERVVYINTFSKTIAPSIRISYMVLPESLMERYNTKLGFYSCTVPSFDQYTLYKFIEEGYFEKHINRMKISYKALRNNIISIINSSPVSKKISISESVSGLHFLIKINTSLSDSELKSYFLKHRIRVNFLSDYSYDANDKFKSTIVFNYSGVNTADLKKALEIIEKWAVQN